MDAASRETESVEVVADATIAPLQSHYAPKHPLNLKHTLSPLSRGSQDPTFRWDGAAAWRTTHTIAGPATLHLAPAHGGVAATAWGPGAELAIAGVPELCGRDDDLADFDVTASPFLNEALHRAPGLRMLRINTVFEMLLPAIFEQKVTTMEARRAWRHLILKYGSAAPGPAPEGMRVMPLPETWRRIPSWDWHRAGVGPQRSQTAVRAASVAASLERTLRDGRGGVVVAGKLRSLPGVGVWTAAETTQRSHGDPDSPSVGDFHLAATVGWALVGKPVDDDGMLELLAPYIGHRHRVTRLIGTSGFRKPSFGPRITVQDHRWH